MSSEIKVGDRTIATGWAAEVAFYAAILCIFLAGFVVGKALF